jgi:DNA-binding transcriptional LysR family regulator
MGKIGDLDSHIGRRIRLRDLHVFITVAQAGSMARAATKLRITQPAVSQVIANLEHSLSARLLDRRPQGIEPTVFGRALLKGGTAAFDSLKQTLSEIEYLADPTSGEVRIGCPETIATLLSPIIAYYSLQYPKVVLHVREVVAPTLELPLLRERAIDVALVRVAGAPSRHKVADDLMLETLFNDEALVVAGPESLWARRRKMKLSDLADVPWILPPANTLTSELVMEAFQSQGLGAPKVSLITFSVSLRANLVANGRYVTIFPRSIMRLLLDRASLRVLPIKLPPHEWPVVMATIKDRTLNPAAQHFIREVRSGIMPQN